MGELPGRNVAKTGKGKNWKSRGRGKEKNMVVEYIPLTIYTVNSKKEAHFL